MLEALISSKTRIKLLLRFFLNSNATGYLRGLEAEFGDSSNGIRQELNRFEEAGLLLSYTDGNKKFFKANTEHPLFEEIHSLLLKHIGIDQIVEQVIQRLGRIDRVYLTGAFAKGLNSPTIDLLLIGNPEIQYLNELIRKAEPLVRREICYTVCRPEESNPLPPGIPGESIFLLYTRNT